MVQSFNWQGILFALRVAFRPSLGIAHYDVRDIRDIDFVALRAAGIRAVVFDKDNTLTAPYQLQIHAPYQAAWESCKNVFGAESIVIVSNSAGTPDDNGYKEAEKVESSLGVSVLRHNLKKPAGANELMEHLKHQVDKESIAVIGDRALTDVVYGNHAGMLTFHTGIVTEKGDNLMAKQARRIENFIFSFLRSRGWTAPYHKLQGLESFIKR